MMARVLVVCMLTSLFALSQAKGFGSKDTKAALVGRQTVFLQLSVKLDEVQQTIDDAKKLKAYGKAEKMGDNVKLMLNTMVQRMEKMVKDAKMAEKMLEAKKIQEQKEAAAREAAGEGIPMMDNVSAEAFTVKPLAVRALKASGYAKKCNIKKYLAKDVPGLVESGEIDLSAPFIVTDGTPNLAEQQKKWTAGNMKLMSNVKVRYLNPVDKAKQNKGMSGMQQQQQQQDEVFEPQIIGFDKYFANCFGDRKRPGTETEYCQQDVHESALGQDASMMQNTVADAISFSTRMEQVVDQLLNEHGEDMAKMVENPKLIMKVLKSESSRMLILGPTGSGSHMDMPQEASMDALIHGARRWLFISLEEYQSLFKKAQDVLGQPASAFGFFEEQYEELVEEHDFTNFYECDQHEGEVMYSPASLLRVRLSLKDSISHFQKLLVGPEQLETHVANILWNPAKMAFNFAVCKMNSQEEFDSLPWPHPMFRNQIAQTLNYNYQTIASQNPTILRMLTQCAGVLALHPEVPGATTACLEGFRDCKASLKRNLAQLDPPVPYPEWLNQDEAEGLAEVQGTAVGSSGPQLQIKSQEEALAEQTEREEAEWRARKAAGKKKKTEAKKGKKKKGKKKKKKKGKKKSEL